ncbi:hypothetical protein K0M31_014283, partial [Melipona bicolor]
MVARIAGELADVSMENGTWFRETPADVARSIDFSHERRIGRLGTRVENDASRWK